MGIKKIGGRWRLYWVDELGKEHKVVMPAGTTKDQAEERLLRERLRVKDIKAGHVVRDKNPDGLTLAQLAKKYVAKKDARLQNAVANHITETPLGALPLDKVTPARVLAHLENLKPIPREKQKTKADLSARTRNHVRKHMLQIFKYAIKRSLFVGKNPVEDVEPETVRRRPMQTLTVDEVARLLGAKDQPWSGIFAAALCGARKGEIFGADVADIDIKRWEWTIRRSHSKDLTKNGRERIVPIHPALRPFFTKAIQLTRSHVLFPGLDGKRRHPRAQMARELHSALKEAKIATKIRFHDLRHTAATLMIQAGAPITHVSKALGHSSIAVTSDVYGHLLVDDIRAAIEMVPLKVKVKAV